ncbi:MAG: hypothetical protein JWN72_2296 [Thermoleophilia bacterium]|nr:hypothetical protein [Thermoleophilia bacterium]
MPVRATAVTHAPAKPNGAPKPSGATTATAPVKSKPVKPYRLKFAPQGKKYRFRAGAQQSIHGVKLLVEQRRSATTDQLLTQVGGWMQSVPARLLDGVDKVQVLRKHDRGLNSWVNKLQGSKGGIVEGLTRGAEITLFGATGTTFETFAHELAHTVPVSLKAWKAAARADDRVVGRMNRLGTLRQHFFGHEYLGNDQPRLTKGAVTVYGTTNRSEDIAESLRLLLSERHYGAAFASFQPDAGASHVRALAFAKIYPHRTALLEQASRSDLDGNGRINA